MMKWGRLETTYGRLPSASSHGPLAKCKTVGFLGPIAQSRLERTPDKREVVGSIPTRPTMSIADYGIKKQ